MMTATQRAAYNRRLSELEDQYQAGEITIEDLRYGVERLDAEWEDHCERAAEDARERRDEASF